MEKKTLSVCMIVKNEEAYLETCLKAIYETVDEIIVVDTGSSDSTIKIANNFQAKVFEIEWINDFSYARNISLQNASMDWVLVLDADEIVPESELNKIYQLINVPGIDAYQIIIHNILPQGEIIPYNEQPALRLFKNHLGIEYRGKIHESVQPSILEAKYKLKKSSIYIEHYGYTQHFVQGGEFRGDRNLSLLFDSINKNKFDPYLHYQLGITYKHLKQYSLAETYLKSALSNNRKELSPLILSDIFLKLAQISSTNNQVKKCIKYAQNSLAQNPNNLISKYLLSISYIEAKQYQQAIPYLDELTKSDQVSAQDKNDLHKLLQFCISQRNI